MTLRRTARDCNRQTERENGRVVRVWVGEDLHRGRVRTLGLHPPSAPPSPPGCRKVDSQSRFSSSSQPTPRSFPSFQQNKPFPPIPPAVTRSNLLPSPPSLSLFHRLLLIFDPPRSPPFPCSFRALLQCHLLGDTSFSSPSKRDLKDTHDNKRRVFRHEGSTQKRRS